MYKTLGGLKNHMKSHGGEEPSSIYFCGECEKSFKTQGGLMHHKCKHVLISDKDFEEKMCNLIENTVTHKEQPVWLTLILFPT